MKHANKFEISLSTTLSFRRVKNSTGYNERYREINAHIIFSSITIFLSIRISM